VAVDAFRAWRERADNFYKLDAAERHRRRLNRSLWWGAPTSAIDRATSMSPKLMHDRLSDFGVDFAVVYPTLGLRFVGIGNDELRRPCIRAYNLMAADMFRPFADRMTPVAVIGPYSPKEALDDLEHAVSQLQSKAILLNCTVSRPLLPSSEVGGENSRAAYYIDCLGLDSAHDYDPVWRRIAELRLAVTTHGGSLGWVNRTSPTSYVSNHLGHFAQGNQTAARTLFMGGVTRRFPSLRFAFLEGGIGWACSLYADLFAHWEKRGPAGIKAMNPLALNVTEVQRLLLENGYSQELVEAILTEDPDSRTPGHSLEKLSTRDAGADDFWAVPMSSRDDIRRLFAEPFYFGCEPDDPITAWAFDRRTNLRLKPVFSSDMSHFDVPDMTQVLAEAYELVEDGLLTEDDFREFTFSNAVRLHASSNPDFFKGTAVENAVAQAALV
jgi:predicted TIM-barrel fold metal-dependent hydrolase